MNEHVFKPGDLAVITANEPRCSTDPPDYSIRSLAEGDVVEVVSGPDSDGDYGIADSRSGDWYVAARYLAPADEPAPDCTHGADCQVHPDARQLHNYDADELPARVAELESRMVALEARLQGVIDTHRLRDGS